MSRSVVFGDDQAREILERARQACWGKAGEPPHDYSYHLVTELETQGRRMQVASKVTLAMPDAFRQEVEAPGGTAVLLFDGKQAWRRTDGGKQPLPPSVAEAQSNDLARRHVLFTPAPEPAWVRLREDQRVGDVNAKVIEIVDVGGSPLRLFVDPGDYDVVKTLYVGDVPGGGIAQVEELLSEYQDVRGYRWALKRKILRNGSFGSLQTLSDVTVNVGLTRADILG